jgi:uncharacterized membrane protein YfcA
MDRPWQDSSAYCPPSPGAREDNAVMSLLVLSVIALATLVTSFISGILGMAGGMILMGVLIVALPLPAAMLLHGITQLAANGWRGWMLRDAIDWRIFRGYAIGAFIALGVFAMVQLVVSKPVALLILGIGPFIGLMLPEKLHLNVERKWHSTACGFICGGLSLISGISGPILDLFFVRSKMGRHAVVATKAVSQSLTHLTKIVYFGGLLTTGRADIAPLAAVLMIALAFAGTTLSRSVLERIDDRVFRNWTRWTMMGVGTAYLIGGASMLARAAS